jgi:hypothetical protein
MSSECTTWGDAKIVYRNAADYLRNAADYLRNAADYFFSRKFRLFLHLILSQ